MTFFIIQILLCFLVCLVGANKITCKDPCSTVTNMSCSVIKDAAGTTVGVFLGREIKPNLDINNMHDHALCNYTYRAWTVVAKNFESVRILGKFEPYWSQINLRIFNFTKLFVLPEAFRFVKLDMFLDPRDENSTIEFLEEAFDGVQGQITLSPRFHGNITDGNITHRDFQYRSSLAILDLNKNKVYNYGQNEFVSQLHCTPHDFYRASAQRSEGILTPIIMSILVITSCALVCCVTVIIMMITNWRANGKYQMTKKPNRSDAAPLPKNSTLLKPPSSNGIKSHASPARNPYPTAGRALPEPPAADKFR